MPILLIDKITGKKSDSYFVINTLNFIEAFDLEKSKYSYNEKYEIWIPILFYQTEEGWQRVGIEKTKCIICGWKGSIANPTLHDLYLALPERFELIRKKSGLKKVGCPKCGSELNRFAIWAE